MKTVLKRISILIICLLLFIPTQSHGGTEQRTALVIGNSSYSSGPLKNPVNDATDMAASLQKLGFTVILKKNVNLRGMEDAITDFGNRLKRGGVGLFYYAGHGLQVSGTNYLIPIGARIEKDSDVKYETVDAGRILDEMANANNGLNIVILDACRDNPVGRRFRSASRGLAIVSSAPVGTFISYSTSPGSVAQDGEGRNSPYTAALLRYMKEPGLTIENVFKHVRTDLGKKTGDKQIPWELSSLRGDFYFVSGNDIRTVEAAKGEASAPAAGLDIEQRKIDKEREKLPEGAPQVIIQTNMGNIEVELNSERAPNTVKNFLQYVNSNFYDGTIFHRVITGFMIQGGGFTNDMEPKKTLAPIAIESNNGLKNDRGTIAMARTSDSNSATSQFFINTKNNTFLNYSAPTVQGYGYTVFGIVIRGMDVVDKIENAKTSSKGYMRDVPVDPVIIEKIFVK